MLRKFGLGIFCFVAFLSNCAYSMQHILQKGATIGYILPTGEPQVFINYMFWAVEATCKIVTEDESDDFSVVVLAKKGKINDIILSIGDSALITVHPNDSLKVSADSGAKVEITNHGLHTVEAVCTTS